MPLVETIWPFRLVSSTLLLATPTRETNPPRRKSGRKGIPLQLQGVPKTKDEQSNKSNSTERAERTELPFAQLQCPVKTQTALPAVEPLGLVADLSPGGRMAE